MTNRKQPPGTSLSAQTKHALEATQHPLWESFSDWVLWVAGIKLSDEMTAEKDWITWWNLFLAFSDNCNSVFICNKKFRQLQKRKL